MKMRYLVVVALIAIQVLSSFAQKNGSGKVQIIQDPTIEKLIEKQILLNETREGIPGYRIQIFFDSGSNSRTKAQAVYEEFSSKFPDTEVYLSFISPNYKVRIGNFRTRLDATRFLKQLQLDYPNAYVVSDQIKLPKTD